MRETLDFQSNMNYNNSAIIDRAKESLSQIIK